MNAHTNSDAKPDLEITSYATAFIDLLGLSHKLSKLDGIFEADVREEDILATARDSIGAVLKLRRTIDDWFYGYAEKQAASRPLSVSEQRYWDRVTSPELVVQFISDSAVLSVRLERDNPERSMIGVFRLIKACAGASLYLTSLGHPCRGGVEIGSGCKISPNEVIGGALVSAHVLESKVAVVPRIVVGDRLQRMLLDVELEGTTSSILEARFARAIRDCLWVDWDDRWIIDVLDPLMMDVLEHQVARECSERTMAVIQRGLFAALRFGDADRLKKYLWLDEYARARLRTS
ncbi:MAG: hypothetical protein ABL982_09510 [Vicinamibacterales bacterium]